MLISFRCSLRSLGLCGNNFFYHTNNLYNVRALTDENGAVVERYRYSAYGSVTILDAGDQEIPESAVGNVYMFQGRRYDPESGLYYYRNRMMSAELGRFLQRDPLGYVDGYCLYMHVKNNPVNYVDPSGESTVLFVVTTVAVHTVGLVTSVILAHYYACRCEECVNEANEYANTAIQHFRTIGREPEWIADWLERSQPGSECMDLCHGAGHSALHFAFHAGGMVFFHYAILPLIP